MSLVIVEAVVKVGSHLVEDLVASGALRNLTLSSVVDRFHHFYFRGHPELLAEVKAAIAKAEPPVVEAIAAETETVVEPPAPTGDPTPEATAAPGGEPGADPGSPDPGTPLAAPDVPSAAAPPPRPETAPPKPVLGPPPGAKKQ